LAYEAADCGLLSPDLVASIRRVKGVKKIGVPPRKLAHSRTVQRLWQAPSGRRLKQKRDRAVLAILLACGVRRHEAVELNFGHIQQRDEHWAIVDLKGKAGHTRTIPMPAWVKNVLDQWLITANITTGRLSRRVHKIGKAWGERLTEKAVWHVVRDYAAKAGIDKLALHDLRSYARIPDYAESTMKHLHLALSWRTETIKSIRHRRDEL
jgi:site-specific recombinase XerD